MREATLGIDIGSTSLKSVLYEPDEELVLQVSSKRIDSRIFTPDPSHFEEDPVAIRRAAHEMIRAAAIATRGMGAEISRICFTGQMHGGLLLDSALNPLSNFITWQDKRADEIAEGNSVSMVETLRRAAPREAWLSTGGLLYSGFLGTTVNWFIARGELPRNVAKISGIYDWIASDLAGHLSFADPTSASAWGLYNIERMGWSSEILHALEIPTEWLPEIVESGEIFGTVRKDYCAGLGLRPGVQVASGMGDTQASYIGSRCTSQDLLLNFGTGSQCMWERENFDLFSQTDTRYLPGGKYLVTIPTLSGGQAYSVLLDFVESVLADVGGLRIEKTELFRIANELAVRSSSDEGVRVNPIFGGSRTKGEHERASITGLDNLNFRIANVIRATLEGMVAELSVPYFGLPKSERHHVGIVGSGNGMRLNPALREVAQSRFSLPLRLAEAKEEAALGAARLASRTN